MSPPTHSFPNLFSVTSICLLIVSLPPYLSNLHSACLSVLTQPPTPTGPFACLCIPQSCLLSSACKESAFGIAQHGQSHLVQLCQAFCPSGHDCTAWLEHASDQELAGAHVFACLETSMRGSGNVYAPTSFQHGYRTWPRHTHSPRTQVFYHRPRNFFPAPYSSLLLLLWWMILSILWSLTP